jgi:hypothetical protein
MTYQASLFETAPKVTIQASSSETAPFSSGSSSSGTTNPSRSAESRRGAISQISIGSSVTFFGLPGLRRGNAGSASGPAFNLRLFLPWVELLSGQLSARDDSPGDDIHQLRSKILSMRDIDCS